MSSFVLGVDVGTTAIKAAVFDAQAVEIGSHTEEYSLLTPRAGWVELNADTYTTTFSAAVRGALRDVSVPVEDLEALGLSAQGETMLCLDADHNPIVRAIVWLDNRATAESEEIEQHFGRPLIHATTGQVAMDAIWPAAKIAWLKRHQPEVFARTAKFVLLKDYLVYRLTGRLVGEDSLLCSTILWDINTRQYWPEMLEYLGITADQLPEIAEQGEIVGSVTPTASAEFGLPSGCPVSVGALDQACGALGIGNAIPGIFSESTGSALTSVTIVEELALDEAGRVPCFAAAIPGQYMLHTFSTGGMVMRWFRDQFCATESQIEELCGINAYYLIDKEVEQVEPGCDGLVVVPHLQGSGPPDLDPYAKGMIYGLTLAHKKQHLARGVMEGVTMVLRRMIDATTQLGVDITEIFSLSGGAKSDAWCQIKADATQLPVRTLHGSGSAACRGAAIIAGVGVGLWPSAVDVSLSGIEFDRSFTPQAENAKVYDELFARFMALQESLKPLLATVDSTLREENR
jgi:sugar (pentulose or hexulose) kinase